MKIVTAPSVRLISAPMFEPHPVYELPSHDRAAENVIATAGKVCYDSFGKDGRSVVEHIQSLVGSGHLSVVEHVHVGVFIEGISRGCSHELVRHRMFNYSQRSTRYTAEDDAAVVLDPFYAELYQFLGGVTSESTLLQEFIDSCAASFGSYRRQLDRLSALAPSDLPPRDRRKWCRGKARQLLPHALETRLVMTGNLRAWRHFFVMRTSRHAEAEIRRLAQAVYSIVEPVAPTVFADLKREVVGGFIELVGGAA